MQVLVVKATATASVKHQTHYSPSGGLSSLICKMGLQEGLDTSMCLGGLRSLLPGCPHPPLAPPVSSYSVTE